MSHPPSDLQQIPGIGPRIAGYLQSVGIHKVVDLKGADPEELYRRIGAKHGRSFDPCLLYVMRCAAYCASTQYPMRHLLKWWNWKSATAKPAAST